MMYFYKTTCCTCTIYLFFEVSIKNDNSYSKFQLHLTKHMTQIGKRRLVGCTPFLEDEKKSSYCSLLDFRIFYSLHGNFGDMGQLPFLVTSGNDTIELVSDYCIV